MRIRIYLFIAKKKKKHFIAYIIYTINNKWYANYYRCKLYLSGNPWFQENVMEFGKLGMLGGKKIVLN